MDYSRADRVAHLIKRVIAEMLAKDVKDPRIGMVTVTDVTVSKDLRIAHVYYSMVGTEEERQESALGLQKATKFMQGELGRRIRLRFTPVIDFRFDSSLEYGSKIDRILHEIRASEETGVKDKKSGER